MKRNVLFVTDTNGDTDEGLSYAIELARMIDKGISILLLNPGKFSERLDDVMTAITFAEAGEHETARGYMSAGANGGRSPYEEVAETCRRSGISPDIHTSTSAAENAIQDYLRQNKCVDMVILSTNLTMNGGFSSRMLKRLVKTVSTPIVTLTKNVQTA